MAKSDTTKATATDSGKSDEAKSDTTKTTAWLVCCPALGGQPVEITANCADDAAAEFRQLVHGLAADAEIDCKAVCADADAN